MKSRNLRASLRMALAALSLLLSACNTSSSGSGSVPPGPGASLSCTSSSKNAWETYGVNAFIAVNEQIFTNVGDELTNNGTTNLGSSFNAVVADSAALATFKGNLAAFLVYVYGGPSSIRYTDGQLYIGPQNMTQKHTGLAVTSAQYDYFLTNIVVPALTTSGVPSGDTSSCFAPPLVDAAFKASIVGK